MAHPAWAAKATSKRANAVAKKPIAAAKATAASEPATVAQAEDLGSSTFDAEHPPATLRVLVAEGASTYFLQDGRPHGVEYAMLLALEKYLNQQKAKGAAAVKLQFIPVDAGELIPLLKRGDGDLAAGLIPVTDAARSLVDFSQPYLQDRWCAVQARGMPQRDDLLDTLALPPGSFGKYLLEENGKTALDAPYGSTSEKLLSALNAADVEAKPTLASRYVVDLWAKRLGKLQVGPCVEQTVAVAWAVSQGQPVLRDAIDRFISKQGGKIATTAAQLTQRYLSPDASAPLLAPVDPLDKLAFFAPVFQLVAKANNLDWLLLAAIGQRETKLSPIIRKNGGPTGVMQVNPQTARNMGVSDPHGNEGNITAAGRYLAHLREMYESPAISDSDQLFFMLAAYNAGEGRVQQLRKQAAKEGLDPNRWENNVAQVARKSVGPRLIDYVSTVSRYYFAYQKKAGKTAASAADARKQ
ncbi:transglycosylase SLT domain-containing protein [Andreprevotia sp. IGB-42]|uniref:transglycosylase SLT domain-containing protein n=1 Tax=Andreprevotia sp. IGB-42 TaxID=2497473 RepID=UPI0013594465|nr:transporter substrate-binding domain-containing protein [Andreprevotia sp. IGB-42]